MFYDILSPNIVMISNISSPSDAMFDYAFSPRVVLFMTFMALVLPCFMVPLFLV